MAGSFRSSGVLDISRLAAAVITQKSRSEKACQSERSFDQRPGGRRTDGSVRWIASGNRQSSAAANGRSPAMKREGRTAADFLWQPGLFDAPAPATSGRAPRPEFRRSLDATSWVDVIPGWLADPEPLFAALLEKARWEQRERWMFDRMVIEPRLTAEVSRLSDAPHPALVEAADSLSQTYGVRYDHLWLNLYRDGHDSTAWHRDRISCRRPGCIVPVLSLGATRRFLMRRREGGPSVPFQVSSGTLLVMGGSAQDDWVHAVPKEPGVVAARISVNFQSSAQAGPRKPDVRRRVLPR
jgi:alkylated DNA repair dioxygenase AlkB